MALTILVGDRSLRRSFLARWRSAAAIASLGHPLGTPSVRHTDLGAGEFVFTLVMVHPRFGGLIDQAAVLREVTP